MGLGSDVARLKSVPFFHGFSDEHVRLLAFSAEGRTLAPGAVLYEAGDRLDSSYVVTAGALEAARGPDGGATRAVAVGELLAARALIVEAAAAETVRAATLATVLQIRRAVFRRLLDESPDMAAALHARLAEELLAASAEYERIARRLGDIEL